MKKEEDIIQGEHTIFAIQGSTGLQGLYGSKGISGTGNIGLGSTNPEKILELMFDDEDKAIARLKTLQELLKKNVNKLENLKKGIKKLENEKRRLVLIKMHIDDGRSYKLDLNKLSAFGFEDIEIESK